MKKFILHTILFLALVMISIAAILTRIDGYSDAFYLKISSPKKSNLILGTSKAAQGIQPNILDKTLQKDFYNFAFTNHASPYGKVYYNQINEKLDKQKENGIFILAVDIWSLSSIGSNENLERFRESKSFLNSLESVNKNPNIEYLLHHFDGKYINILKKNTRSFLHEDGWFEVFTDDDESNVKRRTKFTINQYKTNTYKFSEIRLQYLLKTIDLLNNYGDVYLVKLPVHKDLMKIEDSLSADFDSKIQSAIQKAKGYFDLTDKHIEMQYTDGVHLRKNDGAKISEMIATKIKTE